MNFMPPSSTALEVPASPLWATAQNMHPVRSGSISAKWVTSREERNWAKSSQLSGFQRSQTIS